VPGDRDASSDVPKRVGPYTILRPLGRGGQGTVYLAEGGTPHRRVALKLLRHGAGALDETRLQKSLRNLLKEADILASLDHPGLCRVFDAGIDGSTPYIAMQYVAGETLARRIRDARDRLPSTSSMGPAADGDADEAADTRTDVVRCQGPATWKDVTSVLAIVEKVARALHVAHEAGFVHRDVKPGNIMVQPDGDPVILDFGLARRVADGESQSGAVVGTPDYMSPEQVSRGTFDVDRRSDIYSLGITLFECLTLRVPFKPTSASSRTKAIMFEALPKLRRLNPAVPSDVRVIVETMLQKDPDHRYQSAAELAEDLKRARGREPILRQDPTVLTRAVRWVQRKPAETALGALVLVLGCVVTALVSISIARKRESGALEALARARHVDSLDAWSREAVHRDPALAARLVNEVRRLAPERPVSDVALRAAQSLRGRRPLVGHRSAVSHAAFSPDGAFVLTASLDGTARVWDAETGAEIESVATGRDRIHCVGWVGGRPAVVSTGSGFGVTLRTRQGAKWTETLFERHAAAVTCARMSRHGERLLTASEDGIALVWKPGEPDEPIQELPRHPVPVVSAAFSDANETTLVTVTRAGGVRVFGPGGLLREFRSDDAGNDLAASRATRDPVHCLAALGGEDCIAVGIRDGAFGGTWRVVIQGGGRSPGALQGVANLSAVALDRHARLLLLARGREVELRKVPCVGDEEFAFRLGGHAAHVQAAALSADAARVVTAGADGVAIVWDLAVLGMPAIHDSGLAALPVVADAGGRARVVALRTEAQASDGLVNPAWSKTKAVSADGAVLLRTRQGADDAYELVDVHTRVTTPIEKSVTRRAVDVTGAFSPDAAFCAITTDLHTVVVDRKGQPALAPIEHGGAEGGVVHASFAVRPRQATLLAVTHASGLARIWDLGAQSSVSVSLGPAVTSASLTPDGRSLAVAASERSVRILPVPPADEPRCELPVTSLPTFSRNGSRAAGVTPDGALIVWETGGWREILHDPRPERIIHHDLSATGDRVAALTEGGTLLVYDVAGPKPRATSVDRAFRAVAFAGDGDVVLMVADKDLAAYDAATGRELWSMITTLHGISRDGAWACVRLANCDVDFRIVPVDPLKTLTGLRVRHVRLDECERFEIGTAEERDAVRGILDRHQDPGQAGIELDRAGITEPMRGVAAFEAEIRQRRNRY
jgi:serine/threonine protein kinase/WD40 repeat protein